MTTTKVALIYGGFSREKEISEKSAKCIKSTLDTEKYQVFPILIDKNGWFYKSETETCEINKNNFSFTSNSELIIPDIAYIIIHGDPGENGILQGYFDLLKIPYTTCNSFISALTFNKAATKHYLSQHGINTAHSVLLRKNDLVSAKALIEKLGLPMFIKPNNGGSSFGVTKVKKPEEILLAIENAFNDDHEVLSETFIPATELTCGVMKVCGKQFVFSPTEIVPKKEMNKEFFDYEAKYKGLAEEITPARITSELTKEVQMLSSKIYDILGCNGVVRVDYLYGNGVLYFMEINTVPGMSEQSIIPQQAKYYGMELSELNDMLIQDALNRNQEGN